MELPNKITPFQFYSLLFLCRIFSMVTYIANIRTSLTLTDEVIMAVFTGLFLLISAIPVAIFIKQNNKSNILMRAMCLSPVFAKIICVVYFCDFLYFGVITAVRFGIFTGSVMFPDTNVTFFIFAMLLTAAFIAFKGIESMGRSAIVMLIPVLFALVFVFATQADDFDILNFTYPLEDGIENIFSGAVYSASRTGEVAFILILTPKVKNQKVKHIYFWLLAISITIIITETILSGVLGNFGSTQLFNMYSLSVLAEFGFIERMDALISCLWLLCAAIKTAITIYLCKELLCFIFGKKIKTVYIAVVSLLIFAFAIPIGNNILTLASIIRSPVTIILYALTCIILPVCVMSGEKLKGAKKT